MPAVHQRLPVLRYIIVVCSIVLIDVVGGLLLAAILFSHRLPPISQLISYRPLQPLRVYSSDGYLMAEFGPEHRSVIPLGSVPLNLKKAIIATEDDRFYSHSAVDWVGVLRAIVANIRGNHRQGASTITMQVARDLFLSNERTYKRKFLEVLIAYQLESQFTKDQILELYINQVYLGKRTFGFSAASEVYFGRPLATLNLAECAMLAGLPKAPSSYNPITNFSRAQNRQRYVLQRMLTLQYISAAEFAAAKEVKLVITNNPSLYPVEANYVSDMVRQYVVERYGPYAYTNGINVITTIRQKDQIAARHAVVEGLIEYVKRQDYLGPAGHVLFNKHTLSLRQILEILKTWPSTETLEPALVLYASPDMVRAYTRHALITISGNELLFVRAALQPQADATHKITSGSIIYVRQKNNQQFEIIDFPHVQGALVSADPSTGAVRALVGGFDFSLNEFNHITQAWRQPGSSIKPFIYVAALEKGYTPDSVFDDSPIMIDPSLTGNQPWEPKNFDNKFHGPVTMRMGLAESLNILSVRLLQAIGIKQARISLQKFGFDLNKQPPYFTIVLGAGLATPWQMLRGYMAIANGGYLIEPYLIQTITDHRGKVLATHHIQQRGENIQIMTPTTAVQIDDMLKNVIQHGTGRRALALGRDDLAGKTGTTNNDIDAWFCGYHPNLVSIVWVGYDQPKTLGRYETGAFAALPLWIRYMGAVLPKELPQPYAAKKKRSEELPKPVPSPLHPESAPAVSSAPPQQPSTVVIPTEPSQPLPGVVVPTEPPSSNTVEVDDSE